MKSLLDLDLDKADCKDFDLDKDCKALVKFLAKFLAQITKTVHTQRRTEPEQRKT